MVKAIIIILVLIGLLDYALIVATGKPSDKEQYEAYMKWKERRKDGKS